MNSIKSVDECRCGRELITMWHIAQMWLGTCLIHPAVGCIGYFVDIHMGGGSACDLNVKVSRVDLKVASISHNIH